MIKADTYSYTSNEEHAETRVNTTSYEKVQVPLFPLSFVRTFIV